MFSTILSGAVYGMNSYLVHVEVDMAQGLPCFVMVGSPGSEVRESGERVRVALKNSGVVIPPMHIAVNISPGDIRKVGTGFDLPIAVAVLCAMGKVSSESVEKVLLLGELSLDGQLRPVRGVLPIAVCAAKNGIRHCIVPMENAKEAALVADMCVFGATSLKQILEHLQCSSHQQSTNHLQLLEEVKAEEEDEGENAVLDFSEVVGQEGVKRAALIAAAGFHHLLIVGPPGGGKTMIAKRIPTILPLLTEEERLEVSSIYSISGKLPVGKPLIKRRPFLSPHHSISPLALSGGGAIPKPGVISLAHRGVCFLGEYF